MPSGTATRRKAAAVSAVPSPPTSVTTTTHVPPLSASLGQIGAPDAPIKLTASLTRQYVAAGGFGWVSAYTRTLPDFIDDVTEVFGRDLYRRMRTNPIVEANFGVRRDAIIQNGCTAQVPLGKDDAEYTQAQAIAQFVQYNIDNLDRSFTAVLREMLLSMMYGHKVAELVWELGPPLDPAVGHDQLYLKAIRPKPQEATAFVVDAFMELLGLIFVRPGQPLPTLPMVLAGGPVGTASGISSLTDPQAMNYPPLLPPEKFWISTWGAENSDPRGNSLARPAYFAWWALEQVWAAYLRFLARFAEPSLAGFTDPEADLPEPDPTTGQVISPEQAMLTQILLMANGASGAFPGGSRLEVVESKGDGIAFRFALHELTADITRAMTGQTLMSEVADNMTRAASSVHQDVFGIGIRVDKAVTADDIRRQIFARIVLYNYGPAAARRLTPLAALGQAEHQDFPAYANAIAALLREGYFNDDQYIALDNLLNLPLRDPKLWAARIAREQAALAGAAAPATPGAAPAGGSDPGSLLEQTEQKLDTRAVAKIQSARLAARVGPEGP